jgi:hypothetical protein
MTPAERQVLREKHRLEGCSDAQCFDYGCEGEHGICFECRVIHPCDVIKVLDAWEAERKAIVDALSHGHHEMYEIVNEIAKKIGGH